MAEDAKSEEGEGKGEGEAAPKKSKKKLLLIILPIVLIAAIGIPFMFLGGKSTTTKNEQAQDDSEQHHYEKTELPTMIVNLSESSSFLKVTMVIEYDAEVLERATAAKHSGKGGGGGGGEGGEGTKKGLPGLMAEREPMIKDAIIRVLSSKKAEEVLSSEGKERLKEELVEAINEASGIEEAPIMAIYFTEFIIQ